MKLAMEAFAQDQQDHPVQMEIVAAARTFTESHQKSDYDQNDNPENKQSPHGPVGR